MAKKHTTIEGKKYLIKSEIKDLTCIDIEDGGIPNHFNKSPDAYISMFQILKEKYGADCTISFDSRGGYDGYSELEIVLHYERTETEKERDKRLKTAAQRRETVEKEKKEQRRREIKLFKELKKKYGSLQEK